MKRKLTADLVRAIWQDLPSPKFPEDYGSWGPSEEEDIRQQFEGRHYGEVIPTILQTNYPILIFLPDEVVRYFTASFLILALDEVLPPRSPKEFGWEVACRCQGMLQRNVRVFDLMEGVAIYLFLGDFFVSVDSSEMDQEFLGLPERWIGWVQEHSESETELLDVRPESIEAGILRLP